MKHDEYLMQAIDSKPLAVIGYDYESVQFADSCGDMRYDGAEQRTVSEKITSAGRPATVQLRPVSSTFDPCMG